jgi:hypothetical protein
MQVREQQIKQKAYFKSVLCRKCLRYSAGDQQANTFWRSHLSNTGLVARGAVVLMTRTSRAQAYIWLFEPVL